MGSTFNEYLQLTKLSYKDVVRHLKNKYGEVYDDYYREKSYARFLKGEIKTISRGKFTRTSEGLYTHHILENEYENLSNPTFIQKNKLPFHAQKKDNLVYCDLIEHGILHAKIISETLGEFGYSGYKLFIRNQIILWLVWGFRPRVDWMNNCIDKIQLSADEAKELLNLLDQESFQQWPNQIIDKVLESFRESREFMGGNDLHDEELLEDDLLKNCDHRIKNFVWHRIKPEYRDILLNENAWMIKNAEHKAMIMQERDRLEKVYRTIQMDNHCSREKVIEILEETWSKYWDSEESFLRQDKKYWHQFFELVDQQHSLRESRLIEVKEHWQKIYAKNNVHHKTHLTEWIEKHPELVARGNNFGNYVDELATHSERLTLTPLPYPLIEYRGQFNDFMSQFSEETMEDELEQILEDETQALNIYVQEQRLQFERNFPDGK